MKLIILNLEKVSIGIVFMNEERRVVASLGKMVQTDKPNMVETLAIRSGVKFANDQGFQKVVFELNSKNIIEEIKGMKGRYSWKIEQIVEDIKE